MGIVNWKGVPAYAGNEWPGVHYFTTLRLPTQQGNGQASARGEADQPLGGGRAGAYASFNLGAHVGDEPGAVLSNRHRLALSLPQAPVWLEQVHGVEVLDADTWADKDASPIADAVVTGVPGRVLCVMTADCLPVVLSDLNGLVLGVAHAGWRGLAAGVLENTLVALRARAPAASQWRAWIGPSIGQAAFEVGDEVRAAFVGADAEALPFFLVGARPGKWLADLAGLARHRLNRAGVYEVQADSPCTYERSDLFYSYRRDGRTGRMATVAWLSGSDLPELTLS